MTASRRFAALLGFALPLGLGALPAPPALASGDLCEPRWRIDLASLGDCDTVAALSPGNDTRANLLMLLLDRHGLPPSPPAATAKPVLGWRDFRDGFAPGGAPSRQRLRGGRRIALPHRCRRHRLCVRRRRRRRRPPLATEERAVPDQGARADLKIPGLRRVVRTKPARDVAAPRHRPRHLRGTGSRRRPSPP